MFTCARMDATSFIIGNKIIDCKIFIVKIQFFIISSGNFIIWMRLEEISKYLIGILYTIRKVIL
jgi:hypothetical protein